MAILLVVAHEARAQFYQPEALHRPETVPGLALDLSPSGAHAFSDEHYRDLQALEAFRAGRRPMERFSVPDMARAKPWTLYGRLGVLNFQNALDPAERDGGMRFTLRRAGPVRGKIYVGIHREF